MEKALVVIDLQNDITKNYKEIIGNVNNSINWAQRNNLHVVYIRHYNLTPLTRTFKPDTEGAELVSDLEVVSDNIFIKSKGNALSSKEFSDFINKHEISEFYITGADAVACVKSTTYNMRKADYKVNVLADCITSYNKNKIDEMLAYYEKKGCTLLSSKDLVDA
ncbi:MULTISPECIES: cysteine hydrolase [unclassified Breznakia]|uniref:cysteine hydrolase family protein n=1 Tax=unclassified Breznakia TaxID=2623764 RepID=UPI00240617BE|nr:MULTISPECIES: cysteine hydrolase [unclassified Breznakia]MDF9837041.1 nicotinamidase-related amidase [Breznakia sp. PFB2-8]MDF9858966.1 nicotinamidase-related amidase [Breznakia sp. PH5-24]